MISGKTGYFIKYFIIVLFFSQAAGGLTTSWSHAEKLIGEKKYLQALETIRADIEQNEAYAHYLAGAIFLSREFTHYNTRKGIFHLEQSVRQNCPQALDELAGLYLAGEGVPKNEKKALEYYREAAYLGYGPSQFNCGIMYKEGQGTEKDLGKACFYLGLASLNIRDLGEITQDAARYRDEIVPQLNPAQRQGILRQVNNMTAP